MNFIYPFFLLALLVLAIPVIIHFFNFKRYKTVFFSNVWLLKKLKQETKRKSRLKQLLILTSRLLALAALVFAFSRPYIPVTGSATNASQQAVAVYIDNTFSMKNEGEAGQLLEQAKSKALEIAGYYRSGTQFLLQTSDFFPEQQFFLNKEQFIQEISKIKESPRSPKLSEIYRQTSQDLAKVDKKTEKILYFLSDFQINGIDIEAIKPDTTLLTYLLPFRAQKSNNLMIDSCWFEIPGRKIGQAEKLYAHIKNLSEQAYQNIPVRLTINDTLKAISTINIGGKEETTIELNYTNNSQGIQLCKVELDDYPIIYDNKYFLSYRVFGKLKALGIYNNAENGSEYLKALFTNDELVSYDEFQENNIQISQLKNYQCIFLINNQAISSGLRTELENFVADGGSLVVFPAKLTNYDDYNQLLSSLDGKRISNFDTTAMGISEVNYTHELYRDVFSKKEKDGDLPIIKGTIVFASQSGKSETQLLSYRNGKAALSTHNFGDGKVYTFSFPLNRENFGFVRHVIFVPTVYNIALNSGEQQRYAYSTAEEEPVLLEQSDIPSEVTIRSQQDGNEFVCTTRAVGAGKKQLNLSNFQAGAGHYLVKDGPNVIAALSFNYPRTESMPDYFSDTDLNKWTKSGKQNLFRLIENNNTSFKEALRDANNGKQLWKYFIMLAIFFLACEMAVIRFWK